MSRIAFAGALLLALVLGAPTPSSAASPEATGLLQRAEYWQGRRDDLAREELGKLFRLEPDNPEGLVLQAQIQLRANQEKEAAATLERLRKAHPAHAGVARLAASLRIRGADKDRLRQARQLGRAGRNEEAIKAYRVIFPDGFPDDDLELEYAQLVAGTRSGWEQGRAMLAELVRKHADDPRFQVALASHMSTRKPVGADTLRALRELSATPAALVARQAKEAWRRAVLAMDAAEESLPALRDYIAANPGETAVQERLEEVTHAIREGRTVRTGPAQPAQPPDPMARAKREAWAAIEAGRIEEAESKMQEALAKQPNDGEAAGGLGLVRLRQGRHAEALELLERARRLDGANGAKWTSLIETSRYWGLLQQAKAAREAGQLDVAEARVREARAIDPKEPQGAIEAAHVLREQARGLEAKGRTPEAIAALEQGAALDPDDPWMRHDLARLHAATGNAQRGRALFEDLLRRHPRNADARYAYALFLSGAGHESEALVALESVPGADRSAAIAGLQRRLWVTVQGRRAEALANSGDTREAEAILAAIQAAIGDDRALALEVAELQRGFDRRRAGALRTQGRAGDAAGIYREQLRSTPIDGELRLALAETLMEQGDLAGAQPEVEAALRARPDDPRALAAAGRIAERGGRLDDAIDYEQRSLGAEAGGGESWRYRRLAEMLDRRLSWNGAALDALSRSGTPGKSQVAAQELSLVHRQAWSSSGQWLVRVAPARVKSGYLFSISNS